jgi:excisionase family DNA binding protein
MTQQTWLSVEHIAKELDVEEETVRNWIRRRQLKAYKFGRDFRIKVTDYEDFIERQAVKPDDKE